MDKLQRIQKIFASPTEQQTESEQYRLVFIRVVPLKKGAGTLMVLGCVQNLAGDLIQLVGYSNNCSNFRDFASLPKDKAFRLDNCMRTPTRIVLQGSSKISSAEGNPAETTAAFPSPEITGLGEVALNSSSGPWFTETVTFTDLRPVGRCPCFVCCKLCNTKKLEEEANCLRCGYDLFNGPSCWRLWSRKNLFYHHRSSRFLRSSGLLNPQYCSGCISVHHRSSRFQ